MLRDGIVRVKVWTRGGRILYSDEPRLRGARYPMGADEISALDAGRVEAEVSDLSRPENRFERGPDRLLEVYLPIEAPGGRRLLFEAYQRLRSVSASGRRLWLGFAPALLGGLLLLQLVNLPLARSLARRLGDEQAQRTQLLQRAVDASDLERRRIAADLHDGVVQDLVGVSYALAAEAERLPEAGPSPARSALLHGASRARGSVRSLRALLVDIYPPSLRRAGLAATRRDATTTLAARGTSVVVDVPDDLRLPADVEALLFRCAQEALRNVGRHAAAAQVVVSVRETGETAVLDVRDDGRGFDPAVLERRREQGHVGLQLARDMVADAGGSLTVESAAGRGTTLRVQVPIR